MICTSIEQSKHLLELGLDPKTADMVWMCNKWLYSIKDNILNQEQFSEQDTLAWSLTALLEVMPITITKDGMEHKLKVFPSGLFSTHSDTSKWTLQYCGRDYSYRSRDKYPILVAVTQHDLIDAAYEMVCWLLEQGIIKKEGNDE